jgi:iron(III) transport system substrate-binding protein
MNKILLAVRNSILVLVAMLVLLPIGTAMAGGDFDREALIKGARAEGKLVWYTGAPEGLVVKALKAFSKKYPFIDVSEWTRNSAGRLQAQLESEVAAGLFKADVFQSGDVGQFLAMNDEDWFAKFYTPEQDAYSDGIKNPGMWTGWRLTALLLGYNPQTLKGDKAPTSWNALRDPAFKGKVAFQDGTTGTQHVEWYVLRKIMGDDFWDDVARNNPSAYPGPPQTIEAVLRNEMLIAGMAYSYHIASYQVKQGAPFKGVYPAEGIPIAVQPIAVMKTAPHPNAARLFVDWALSREGQKVVVEGIGDYSGRPDAPTPAGNPPYSEINSIPPDSFRSLINTKKEFIEAWKKITGS